MSQRSEKRTGNGPRSKTDKRQYSLESLEVYEVAEKAPEADLEAAETILARLLVDAWFKAQGQASVANSSPNEGNPGRQNNAQ